MSHQSYLKRNEYVQRIFARVRAGWQVTLATFRIPYWEDDYGGGIITDLFKEVPHSLDIYIGLPSNLIEARKTLDFANRFKCQFHFQWGWHAKYVIFNNGKTLEGYLGSHNLCQSTWVDLSVHLTRDQIDAIMKFHKSNPWLTAEQLKTSISMKASDATIFADRFMHEEF